MSNFNDALLRMCADINTHAKVRDRLEYYQGQGYTVSLRQAGANTLIVRLTNARMGTEAEYSFTPEEYEKWRHWDDDAFRTSNERLQHQAAEAQRRFRPGLTERNVRIIDGTNTVRPGVTAFSHPMPNRTYEEIIGTDQEAARVSYLMQLQAQQMISQQRAAELMGIGEVVAPTTEPEEAPTEKKDRLEYNRLVEVDES